MSDQLLTQCEWRGFWWHPSDPEAVVSGTLKFVPDDGLTLTVIGVSEDRGQFRGVLPGGDDERTRWDVLYGLDDNNRQITLYEIALTRTGSNSVVSQEMAVIRAVIGCHIDGKESPGFDAVSTTVNGLSDFVRIPQADAHSAHEIAFHLPRELSANLWLRKSQKVEYSVGGASRSRHDEVVFSAQSAAPRPASELIRTATKLEALISVAYQHPMRMRTLRLRLAASALPSSRLEAAEWVDVYQDPSAVHDARRRIPSRPTFTCDPVSAGSVVSGWFAVMDDFRGPCQMLLTLLYEQTQFVSPRVVTAVTAAEAMQSALVQSGHLYEAHLLPPDEYQEFVETVEEGLTPINRARMMRLLRSNRDGLAGRLESLATQEDGRPLGDLLAVPGAWAAKAADARNKIAHGSVRSLPDVVTLRDVVETAQAVVTLRLLQRLGLDEEQLRTIVSEDSHFRWVRTLAQQQFS